MLFGRFAKAAVLASTLAIGTTQAFAIDQATIDAAKQEGEVVWYSGMIVNQIVRPIVEAFEAKYPGIKVNAARHTSSEVVLKVQSEAQAGRPMADVFDGSSAVFPLMEAGLVEPYKPEAAADFDERTKDPDGYWTAANLYFMVPAINTTLVSEADRPDTYEKLLNPKWTGKIAWTSDPTMLGAPGFIYTVMQTMGEEKGSEYLEKLAAQNIVNVPASQRVVLDKVIAGEFPIGLMTFNHHSAISAQKGAPVEWVKLEPVIQAVNPLGIVKNAQHPNAAKLLVEFILSEEGQSVMRDALYIPANPNVPAAEPTLKPKEGGFETFVISPEATARDLKDMVAIYDRMFK
ncbi:extracellular solute-binding protein [Chelativorans sp. AA-79]|uniref:ABC transporter substrate-binding protein n=1 Tax=Chelativorans sp. AA-79 TaxID=3028735 RepID=UPI0023F87ED1|nr:extracellular solute-binding protein [Chelativorans sp. AA-79]WEX08723.1 extracellular solute-binding protein [Chelativorans sp. AA-79]